MFVLLNRKRARASPTRVACHRQVLVLRPVDCALIRNKKSILNDARGLPCLYICSSWYWGFTHRRYSNCMNIVCDGPSLWISKHHSMVNLCVWCTPHAIIANFWFMRDTSTFSPPSYCLTCVDATIRYITRNIMHLFYHLRRSASLQCTTLKEGCCDPR